MRKIDIISILLLVFMAVVVAFQFKYERTCSNAEKEYGLMMNETIKEKKIMYEQHLKDTELVYQQYLADNNATYEQYLQHDIYLRNVTCNMYGVNKTTVLVRGLYFDDGFYCVATINRSYCDVMNTDPTLDCINKTAFHELSHAMISGTYDGHGPEHFCKGGKNEMP